MRAMLCVAAVCKWHDVPKRTEDILVLCINFYPLPSFRAAVCAVLVMLLAVAAAAALAGSKLGTIWYLVPFAPTEIH